MKFFILVLLLFSTAEAQGRNLDGRWSQLTPSESEWMKKQQVPGTKEFCCNEADGFSAQEDIVDGRYVVSFEIKGWKPVVRMLVPDEAVIKGPNRYGRTVVWVWFQNAEIKIRCFIPGAGI